VGPGGEVTTTGGFAAHGAFHIRFTPREPGRHDYAIDADSGDGFVEIARGSVVAGASDLLGFVRIDPSHPHRLETDDGRTRFVLGENRINVYDKTWNGGLGVRDYVRRMASFGMSTIRVFVFSDCESESDPRGYQIGCLEPAIGRFDERTADAFDELFDAAEESRIDVVLVAFAIGFTPGSETWKSWADNPYSVERGGLAESPEEFFSDPAMRAHAERRLRYIADRWGSSPRLLAIDLLNEPEWDGTIPEQDWIPWAEQMSRAWRAFDPYGHLVTVGSVGLEWNVGGDERPLYGGGADDIVQWHLYGKPFYEPHALAAEVSRRVDATWPFARPVVCGEFAYGGEDKSTYDHTHVGIWSLLFSGAGALAHSAPPFEIDSDEPMTPERGAHFHALASFLGRLDPRQAYSPVKDVTASANARAWSLVTDDGRDRAVWLLAGEDGYGEPASDVELTIPEREAGDYDVEWVDDTTGDEISEAVVRPNDDGTIEVMAPPFLRHVAARVVRVE
jgi:hypothetical protein